MHVFFLIDSYFFLTDFSTLFSVPFLSFRLLGYRRRSILQASFFSLFLLCMFVLVLFVSICKVLILFVVMHVFFLIIIIFCYVVVHFLLSEKVLTFASRHAWFCCCAFFRWQMRFCFSFPVVLLMHFFFLL